MDFVCYISFIQIAIAFNFAFISFPNFKPFKLFETLFDDVRKKITNSDETIENRIVLLESSLQMENKDEITGLLKEEIDNLHKNINLTKSKINYRVTKSPQYFQHVCLMLGLYSIFLLFILSDYQHHTITNRAWPIFFIGIFLYFLYYLVKEWLVFRSIKLPDSKTKNLKIVIVTTIIFVLSYMVILFWDYIIMNVFTSHRLNINITTLKYYSIILPYLSFVVCFCLHSCSIIYAKWKLFWIKIKIQKQQERNNQILRGRKKQENIQFN